MILMEVDSKLFSWIFTNSYFFKRICVLIIWEQIHAWMYEKVYSLISHWRLKDKYGKIKESGPNMFIIYGWEINKINIYWAKICLKIHKA